MQNILSDQNYSKLLELLIESNKRNLPGNTGNRYDEKLMGFCQYLISVAGSLAYTVVAKNLGMPCERTVRANMDKVCTRFKDGKRT